MGHSISGFVARLGVLRGRTAFLREARVAALEQGLGFLPATDELYDALGGEPVAGDVFYRLNAGLARLGAWISRGDGVAAYLETDYFSGTGEQAVLVWRDGKIVALPEKARGGVVSRALAIYLDVEKGAAHDAFDAAGLGRHRSNDDRMERAEAESPPAEAPSAPPELAATSGYPDRLLSPHRIAGFVARREVLLAGTGGLRSARVAALEQGLGFLPVTAELVAQAGDASRAYDSTRELTAGLASLGARMSVPDSVLYVETDYADGDGTETAMVWHGGDVMMEPSTGRLDAISGMLFWVDAERGAAYDEFEAVGLHLHRDNAAWSEAAASVES